MFGLRTWVKVVLGIVFLIGLTVVPAKYIAPWLEHVLWVN